MTRTDYIIIDRTNSSWPGRLPYRSTDSRTGYPTREAAEDRLRAVVTHYNARDGRSPGDLRVVERTR